MGLTADLILRIPVWNCVLHSLCVSTGSFGRNNVDRQWILCNGSTQVTNFRGSILDLYGGKSSDIN